jgi:hypothetical protein
VVTIRLPFNPTDKQFDRLSRQWDSTSEVSIALPDKMNDTERNSLIQYLLSKVPHAVAFGALCDLAESPGVPSDLLGRMFEQGDVACKVAVCLRDDLTPDLMERCRTSTDPDVREHFRTRQTALALRGPR